MFFAEVWFSSFADLKEKKERKDSLQLKPTPSRGSSIGGGSLAKSFEEAADLSTGSLTLATSPRKDGSFFPLFFSFCSNCWTAKRSPLMKKVSTPSVRMSGRKHPSVDLRDQDIQIEVKSVSLPEKVTPATRVQQRLPRRLSRVNPRDVKRLHEGPTFGVPLAHQMFIGYEEFVIPPILHCTTEFLLTELDVEGLFRVSGSQDEIQEWKVKFNAGEPVAFHEKTSAHNVAGLLKSWLRELPEPLLTYAMFDEWMRVATKTIKGDRDKAIRSILRKLDLLPSINVAVLSELFLFLYQVTQHSSKNLMNAENVGITIGPNILSKENQDAISSATVMPAAVGLAAFFVANAKELFDPEKREEFKLKMKTEKAETEVVRSGDEDSAN